MTIFQLYRLFLPLIIRPAQTSTEVGVDPLLHGHHPALYNLAQKEHHHAHHRHQSAPQEQVHKDEHHHHSHHSHQPAPQEQVHKDEYNHSYYHAHFGEKDKTLGMKWL
jgi:hypothetical protein